MIVSELNEALLYQVETTQEELDRENLKWAMRLRTLFDERIPLSEMPKRMLAMDDVHSSLTTFNYKSFFLRINKMMDFLFVNKPNALYESLKQYPIVDLAPVYDKGVRGRTMSGRGSN